MCDYPGGVRLCLIGDLMLSRVCQVVPIRAVERLADHYVLHAQLHPSPSVKQSTYLRIYPAWSLPPSPPLQHIHERRVLEIRHVVERRLVQLRLVEPLRPQPLSELNLVLRRLGLVHDRHVLQIRWESERCTLVRLATVQECEVRAHRQDEDEEDRPAGNVDVETGMVVWCFPRCEARQPDSSPHQERGAHSNIPVGLPRYPHTGRRLRWSDLMTA